MNRSVEMHFISLGEDLPNTCIGFGDVDANDATEGVMGAFPVDNTVSKVAFDLQIDVLTDALPTIIDCFGIVPTTQEMADQTLDGLAVQKYKADDFEDHWLEKCRKERFAQVDENTFYAFVDHIINPLFEGLAERGCEMDYHKLTNLRNFRKNLEQNDQLDQLSTLISTKAAEQNIEVPADKVNYVDAAALVTNCTQRAPSTSDGDAADDDDDGNQEPGEGTSGGGTGGDDNQPVAGVPSGETPAEVVEAQSVFMSPPGGKAIQPVTDMDGDLNDGIIRDYSKITRVVYPKGKTPKVGDKCDWVEWGSGHAFVDCTDPQSDDFGYVIKCWQWCGAERGDSHADFDGDGAQVVPPDWYANFAFHLVEVDEQGNWVRKERRVDQYGVYVYEKIAEGKVGQ